MQKISGVVFLVLGLILLVVGFEARDSVSSQLSQTFTGSPSNKALILLTSGAVCSVIGLGVLFGSKAKI